MFLTCSCYSCSRVRFHDYGLGLEVPTVLSSCDSNTLKALATPKVEMLEARLLTVIKIERSQGKKYLR